MADFTTLLIKAETAMTEARARGQLSRLYVPQDETASRRRVMLLTELHAALTEPNRSDELRVLYQPQVEVSSGRLAGLEALLRWQHPRWGLVPTDELIRAVEASQVMQLLTRRVVTDVLTQLGAWNAAGYVVHTAVNVSVGDLYADAFEEHLKTELSVQGVRPEQVTIEITEGLLRTDPDRLVRATERITALGVGLSLDDFGTGFASLQDLRRFPLTEVKIDKSYVDRLTASGPEGTIVHAVHDVADAMRLRMVAEGIEDTATADALAKLPGVIGQGWYYGRAMPASEVLDWPGRHGWLPPASWPDRPQTTR